MVKESKRKLRKAILERRKQLTEKQIEELSRKVIENLKNFEGFKKAKTVMLYYPVKGEVDLRPLFEEIINSEKKILLLPKVSASGELYAVEVSDLKLLKPGYFGIPEPLGGRIFKPEKVDFVAVPGVAFDREGYRLGMGKGFYDRFLPRVKGQKVGIAYDFQVVESVPKEEHDVRLDAVITPTRILKKEEGDA